MDSRGVALCLSLMAVAGGLWAQRGAGEIRLDVRDPSGAPMEASGQLTSLAAGINRSFQTESSGTFALTGLPFGRYRLQVSKNGFAPQSQLVDVQSETPVSRTVTLTLSAAAFQIDVAGATPLPGVDLTLAEIPSPVQRVTARDIETSGSLDLSDLLNRRLNGVYRNEVQGNPVQADLNYRGYTASPLLGTPQGVSVYMDGVRLNQPFGDVVSWDLIPRIAIADATLMPGSNPLFGLNTLGGAISIQTKDGRGQPRSALQMSGGSFGRKMADFEHGGSHDSGFHWYLAGNLFFEDGWRQNSPSNVRQIFGKLGWQFARTTLGLTVAYANNSLNGNGLQERGFLERDYRSVYTKPDTTANRAPFTNFQVQHAFTNRLTFSGNVYYRYIRTLTLNGDINEDSLDQALYQPNAAERAALSAAGYTGFPVSGESAANTPFPSWRCIAQALLLDEPAEKCNGLINRTRTNQRNYGTSGQLTWFAPGGSQLTAGAAYDRSGVDFVQTAQLGYLNPDRSVTGVNAFGDGVNGGDADGEPYDARVDLDGDIRTASVFATGKVSLARAWNATLSGRYNRTTIDNRDRITPLGQPGSLSAGHAFGRFNPAAGLTFSPSSAWSAYFSYGEGSRAPTSIELGCADPERPCKLPNAMAGDPPLHQVVARTFEAGIRGGSEKRLSWNGGWFFSENRNDILFVASQQTGFGYFKNFGKTRRQGIELGANLWFRRVGFGAGYTLLDATFRSPEEVNGEANSTNDDEIIGIEPGDRIPLVPRHMLKAYADIRITGSLSLDLGMLAASSSYARGNENNRHQPDGQYYLGSGTAPAYAVVNLGARYQVNRRVRLFAQVSNLFNRQYYTAAQLGPTGFTNTGSFIARPFPAEDGEFPVRHETFYAPGAPRAAWAGIRLSF